MTPVAVCIVSFCDPQQILDCLAALSTTAFAEYEVLICENGGPESFQSLIRLIPSELPGGQAVTCSDAGGNLGYSGGVNHCIAMRPDARAWWILNPDALVSPQALGEMLQKLEAEAYDAVGGLLLHPQGTVQACGGRWHMALARAESIGFGQDPEEIPPPHDVERRMNYILGASMLISPRFVATVGLMREDYFLYAEEIEWCLRGLKAGMRLGYAPQAVVHHGQGATTGSAAEITARPRLPIFLDERNKLLVVRDSSPALLAIAVPAAFGLTLLRFARRRAWRQWHYAVSGWWAGVRGVRGRPSWLD